jgi:UDP-N-acetylglucosamine--dolichyl-phosphate N-acetylglucosaminephosphotransferase
MDNLLMYVGLLAFSFLITVLLSYFLIPRLKRSGMVGKDVNKPDKPEVAEMGGIAIVAGLTAGVLLAVFLNTFFDFDFNLLYVLAALITIHSVAFIGIVDDMIDIPQRVKALLPLFAAIPLVAISAGNTAMILPFVGEVNLGLIYLFVLVPVGVAVASNLTNMLAGFNGMEAGMGAVIFAAASILAIAHGNAEMLVLFLPMFGALLAFLIFNWYPAKAFPGDVGNLTIGVVLAAGVIIGNFEMAGALLLIPYVVDFFIKAVNRFPSREWWGEVGPNGKLRPVGGKVRGFAQLIMKKTGGITERDLTLTFIGMEVVVALVVILFYMR